MTSTEPTMNTNPLHLESGAAHPVAKPHRVGLKDIADELGISQTAVSFAINDRPRRLRRDQKARQRGCVEAWLEPGVCGAGARLIEDHDGWLRPGTLLKRSSGRRLHAAFHDRFA